MELKKGGGGGLLCLLSVLLFISSSVSASSPTYLSGCRVNFEDMNYTIFTSQCKGPKYPPALCCGTLKPFACRYADELNDLTNECASIMFSYIYGYGQYPPGLFSSECRDTKLGLVCPDDSESDSDSNNNDNDNNNNFTANAKSLNIVENQSPLLVVAITFLVLCVLVF